MIKYFYIAILGFSIFCNLIAQEEAIKIKSVSIDGNKSIKKKELMPLLRQRPSNFSFTFKGRPFNNRLLKMDALTLKNYFISKGFLLADVKESASFHNNEADIVFNVSEGKQFFISEVNISGNLSLSSHEIQRTLKLFKNDPFNSVLLKFNPCQITGTKSYRW